MASNTAAGLQFSGTNRGPINQAIRVTDPLKCFDLLLLENFYVEVLVQTNLYADVQYS